MHVTKEFVVYGALALVQLIVSGWYVLCSLITDKEDSRISPLIFVCYRESIALIFMYATAILLGGGIKTPPRKLYARLTVLGLLNFGNIVGFILGVCYTTAAIAALYQCAIPAFTVALGILAKQEELDLIKLGGIMIAVLGALVATVYSKKKGGLGHEAVLGHVLLVVQTMSMSALLVLQRPLLQDYPPSWVVAWGYTGGVLLCALSVLYYADHPSNWNLEGVETQVALMYAALLASGLVQNLIAWGNKLTRSSIVATFTTMQPILTAVICYSSVHRCRTVPLPMAIGGVVALIGIVLTCWRHQRILPIGCESEEDDPPYNRSERKTSYDQQSYKSSISQSTKTKHSFHYHTPAERLGLVGTGYTPLTSDGHDRLGLAPDTMRISRIFSNESQTLGLVKGNRWSTSHSYTTLTPQPSFS